MTGPEAMVGNLEKTGLELRVCLSDNQVAGRPVEIIDGDAGGSACHGYRCSQKDGREDKVVAIFGPTEIGEKMAVAGYCKQAGIPLILYNPSPSVILEDNKWVIASGGTTPQNPSCMGDYLYHASGV